MIHMQTFRMLDQVDEYSANSRTYMILSDTEIVPEIKYELSPMRSYRVCRCASNGSYGHLS
jgi:hypothetical protein